MKKFLVGTLCLLLTTSAFLPETFAMAQGGKYDRFLNSDLKAQLKAAKQQNQKVPVMPRGLSAEERSVFITNLDAAVQEAKRKGGSAGLQQAVRLWEAMSTSEKEAVLTGRNVAGLTPVAAAAIGAVMLAYIVARDLGRAAGKQDVRSMTPDELNYIEGLKMDGFAPVFDRQMAEVAPSSLDYSEGYATD